MALLPLLRKRPLRFALNAETQVSTIESSFQEFTERKDIAILLINQHVAYPPRNQTHDLADDLDVILDCREDTSHSGEIPASIPDRP